MGIWSNGTITFKLPKKHTGFSIRKWVDEVAKDEDWNWHKIEYKLDGIYEVHFNVELELDLVCAQLKNDLGSVPKGLVVDVELSGSL